MKFDVQKGADILWNAWQTGTVIEGLPEDLKPVTRLDAYAMQATLEARSSRPPAGWKIAATSCAGQKHINVSGPLAGRLLAERMHNDGSTLSMVGNRMAVAEVEFVFAMEHSITPRPEPYSLDEVMASVGDLFLGIEVPNTRFATYTTAGEMQHIADNACAHEFILGSCVSAPWRQRDLAAHFVHATVEGHSRRYERDGVGGNVLGDPRIALAWLVNELSIYGITLAAGQYVTTGTCMVPLEIETGDKVVADFGVLGRIGCRFED
ncbi:fumarylacetoacetate (FAA) hydrolase family protein [Collimonas fungivorans]|uniref:Fumarylacetoacetate (FAA) hydrolase family protein n=1 Tax=Collimonas fungivorans TaxID=158899 RepID=A0A127P678_9BURK|nr:hydratase [Collimonas fungivorans]AMO93263.1 fumarylacetoacetate (FAA) hydrolase family protein [Collimonas fungivorans]